VAGRNDFPRREVGIRPALARRYTNTFGVIRAASAAPSVSTRTSPWRAQLILFGWAFFWMQQPDAADGSLTLYVQKDSPGANKESDWLPARNGSIYMVMRPDWPKQEAAGDHLHQ